MKNLMLLIVLVSGNSFAQSNYSITKDASIYDLPGGDFITAKLINDKTHLKHYDVSGSIIWEDSLAFQLPMDTVMYRWIARFKNTDKYIVCMSRDLSLYWSNSTQNDTLIYQFSLLDLSNHQFTNHYVDTFVTIGLNPVEMRDTSIYINSSDKSLNNNPFNHKTYSLNPSLQISLIAPPDSVEVWPYGCSYYVYGDSIYKYQNIDDIHYMDKYSTGMSLNLSSFAVLGTTENFNKAYYKQSINYDSVFVFTQGVTNGSANLVKWRMDWTKIDFTSINTTTFNAPLTDYPLTPVKYRTSFYKVALDKQNRKIMVLANEEGNIQPEIVQKVFVYDYNFNLECEIPITLGSKTTNKLTELNGLVYLNITNQNSTDLVLVDCQLLGVNESEIASNNFVIYPNPTSNLLFIDNSELGSMEIEIYSTEGKLMQKISGVDSKITIDLGAYETGIYLISIEANGVKQTKRVLKN